VRAAYSSDSSNYRQVPLGVVFPVDHADVEVVARLTAEVGAALLARGAGTSLAGQCCNEAVVIDMSRHMDRIIEIDPGGRWARVEPGVVLDDLRRAAERHGLTFGPDPATHAWCTLGGMIGNNSCGTHGLYAGKTSDNVDRLRLVLAGGDTMEVGAYSLLELDAAISAGGRLGTVLGGLRDLHNRYGALVAERFPVVPRRVSGFNLDELAPERGTHVARCLVGTESTCALTTEATVRLVRSPPERCLVALGYPDIFAAAEAVPELLRHPLLALEGFDRTLVDQMEAHGLNRAGVALLPEGDGWLLAELGADTADEAVSMAAELIAALPKRVSWRRADGATEQSRLWAVRESGLGATAIRLDGRHNYEGWEDGAVPPARLAQYLRGITALWAEHGYSGAWYGHFGQGCVHTRNNFDFGSTAGLRNYRRYVTAAAELVVSLGGSLSGEHGDGQSRAELLAKMFDPNGLMNPGKVVDPYPLDSNVRYHSLSEPASLRPSAYAFGDDAGSLLHAVLRCVGVGRCRRDDVATMCPSFRATRDEVQSTRGRAKVLGEMFQGGLVVPSWHNEEVHEALELCLSCKACASDCPTHVDMATYKSEFLYHYYRRRLRPVAMYAVGLLPWAARFVTASPAASRLVNSVLRSPGLVPALKRAAGIAANRPVPVFSPGGGLRRRLWRDSSCGGVGGTEGGVARGGGTGDEPGPPTGGSVRDRTPATTSVVVWPDTFTDAFSPGTGADIIAVLSSLGEHVAVPSGWACCGRTLYDFGMLGLARRSLRRLVGVLQPWVEAGVPVVVPEPSCLAAFRDELPALLHDEPLAHRLCELARSPAEHLVAAGHLERLGAGAGQSGLAVLHPHCHQRSVVGTGAEEAVLEALGYRVEVLDAGCCGLAGPFGFNARHEPVSRRIGQDLWLPKVREALRAGPEAGRAHLVVDGFSCYTQLVHLAPDLSAPDVFGSGTVTNLPALLRRHMVPPSVPAAREA
jgi:FAD/FMN-containing dehydrogenase/Fe-S oxidoreductase